MEKIYKLMKGTGVFMLVMGILTILFGTLCGSFMVAAGGKLLAGKNRITI